MAHNFISFEDEIQLRLSIRAAYKHEGWTGIINIMGELATSLQIVLDVAKELRDEKENNAKK